MSGPETNFYEGVHRRLPPVNTFYRVKNHNMYAGGIADFWFSGRLDMWVEYKFLEVPKRPTTVIDFCNPKTFLSALQQDWLESRHHEGRHVAVIVGCKAGGVILDGLAWKQPMLTADFNRRILRREEIAAWILNSCS